MKGSIITFLFLLFILLGLTQSDQHVQGKHDLFLEAEKLYKEATELPGKTSYTEAKENELYRKALAHYNQLLPQLQPGDSLRFYTLLRAGVIYDGDNQADTALLYYIKAIHVFPEIKGLADSLLFQPLLFAGSIHYAKNHFDSALYYYKAAEAIQVKYTVPLANEQRLWNRLGAMHYETGNYKQSLNYFEKALSVLPRTDPDYIFFVQNYRNNIASALLKLERYDEAREQFMRLLPEKHYTSEICMNLGSISLSQSEPEEAIQWFNRTIPGERNELLYHSKLAKAFLDAGRTDSAAAHLDLAEKIFINEGNKRNYTWGSALELKGQIELLKNNTTGALRYFQLAIIQYHNSFNDTALARNPEKFNGAFSYIQLFNVLVAKAETFSRRSKEHNTIDDLSLALDTWDAAFKLAAWVERTYTSDEARLFLGRIKHDVHSKAINLCLYLYEKTAQISYLEKAYYFDQENKASVLSLNIAENEWRQQSQNSPELFRKEDELKKEVTRLSLQIPRIKDSAASDRLQAELRDAEISLEKLQEKIAADPAAIRHIYGNKIPAVNQLQQKLDNNSALLSYHLGEKELIIFLISNKKFNFFRVDIDLMFYERINLFKKELQPESDGQRYEGNIQAAALYKTLIQPALPALNDFSRLIIIPDDELHLLPFEALQDDKGKYLIENFSVQYQYSTALFNDNITSSGRSQALAYAPFTRNDFMGTYAPLPSSKDEIDQLHGLILTDSAATKTSFLRYCNNYPLLHLATHASVNNDTPSHSFIAFYPGKKKDENLLYANEIADLRLDSVQLVILSACETGAGKLVKGEGLMSLSRSFAAAGCPDIITSLWKADDQTTAYITQRLHYYLEKGYSKDKALQQAKLDLLHSNEVDPRLKTPGYWAHLIFIGNYEEDRGSKNWWWIAISIIVGTIAYKLIKLKRNGQM